MTLFEPEPAPVEVAAYDDNQPLAARMRPRTLDEVVGQAHLLAPGSPLRRLVEGDAPMSLILFGPPGTGKTTLATIVSNATNRRFEQLSALNAGVKDVREVIARAKDELGRHGRQTVLFIDEIHRFSKTQQDSLLSAVEARHVTLVAATTENPFFSIVGPLLSRSLLLTLQPLDEDAIGELVDRALADERGLAGSLSLDEDARAHLLRMSGGDARRALTALEASAGTAVAEGKKSIDLPTLEQAVDTAAVRYDRDGDQHYDVISAFIKSIRGSDPDAALHYLARMIEAGEDPRFIARRLVVHASEDVGLADPTALLSATAAAQAVQLIGMPEARINLAQATIHLATAPKSNAVVTAIDRRWMTSAPVSPGRCRPRCAMATTRAPASSVTPRPTSTRTRFRTPSSRSSTHRTSSSGATTTARARGGRRRCSASGSPGCGRSSAAHFADAEPIGSTGSVCSSRAAVPG